MKKILTVIAFSIALLYSTSSSAQEDYSALNLFVSFGSNAAINGHYEIPIAENLTVSPAATLAFDLEYIALESQVGLLF
ncbi:MAG: hypothetical protein U5K51_15040 [Flavobacteriaceae bacterium]|nr:hypothetical protein [Flavobacteriaceae bacterium]